MFYIVSQPSMRPSYGHFPLDAVTPQEQYYRRLAEEHSHQAAIALARARYQEQQAARRAELTQECYSGFNPFVPERHIGYPFNNNSSYYAFGDVYPEHWDHVPLPHNRSTPTLDQILRREAEARIEAAVHARRQRELDESRRLQFIAQRRRQEKIRQESIRRKDAFEEMLLSILGSPAPSTEAVQDEEPSKPANHCQAGACPSSDSSRPNPFEELLAGFLNRFDVPHSDAAKEHCTCNTCKRASQPSSPVARSAPVETPQSSGSSNSKGKGKAPEVTARSFHQGLEQVNGHVLPLGLSAEERQQILSALGVTTTNSDESASTPKDLPDDRTSSLTSISALESKFNTLKSTFDFPSKVDFSESASVSSPSLAFNTNNLVVNGYENDLNSLLSQIDEIQSNGEEEIREKRKSLVLAVESELESLDKQKAQAWVQKEKEHPTVDSKDNGEETVSTTAAPLALEEAAPQTEGTPVQDQSTNNPEVDSQNTASQPSDILAHSVTVTYPPSASESEATSRPRGLSAPADLPSQAASVDVDALTPTVEVSVLDSDPESDANEFVGLIDDGQTTDGSEAKDEVVGYELI